MLLSVAEEIHWRNIILSTSFNCLELKWWPFI